MKYKHITAKVIEKLDKLPQRERICMGSDAWRYRRTTNHPIGHYYADQIIKRLVKKYEGMEYDFIFSIFCQKVPKYQQYLFDRELGYYKSYYWFRPTYVLKDGKVFFNRERRFKYNKQPKRPIKEVYEAITQKRKDKKLRLQAEKEKQYSMLSKSEIKLKEEKEIDKYKILAHGFDLITSFRNEKQTNPDLIKLNQ